MDDRFIVTVYPALEHSQEFKEFEFDSIEKALAAKNSMADLLLFIQDKMSVMRDYSNVFGIETYDGGGWIDVDELDYITE